VTRQRFITHFAVEGGVAEQAGVQVEPAASDGGLLSLGASGMEASGAKEASDASGPLAGGEPDPPPEPHSTCQIRSISDAVPRRAVRLSHLMTAA
jgi:hypothetical protein